MLKVKNRIEELIKKIKGTEKGNFGGSHLLSPALHRDAKLNKYITLKKTFPLLAALISFLNPCNVLAADKYRNFEELKSNESPLNYNIFTNDLRTPVLILAPHGGGIEGGTSELARELSKSHSTYLFEALKTSGSSDLHITSANFDEPQALEILNNHDLTISLHGYASNEKHTLVGGTDREKAEQMTAVLNDAGFSAELLPVGAHLAGTNPNNIANKNKTGMSIQLEISTEQRRSMFTTFSLKGRDGTKNEMFYDFVNAVSQFIDENVGGLAGEAA
ncbi:poly-gamma-glutamate hydrolase family protein [Bacillus atrophaeus]|uniref:poly-gamma-glutamate hydrolase family protein n=1 Tax=Bacillus atrophaeus TaxID=1452 RepID=UPI00228155AD|nr:poly-gamma-glutamate hydrolase family protein [Bacillus atrophaeus]MCY8958235.1 poly-gamma-glutamate hydrolase family protein [Bacillus atrophaeus]MCY8963808.1 poly-gamma-glutamate hydrolase family protein [Bacillus atrophaeus]MCY9161135.1 poly-gamma-glutamate hydrolase family protein [Bacillus atrophaeus]MCY9440172.1 poly-gamma-glutamate hydrolase family protein [Bacillus atrophaeus]MEC0648452.1 poly-gamma-glutamate hydrolase family protein [Bacillus atrophaeus]